MVVPEGILPDPLTPATPEQWGKAATAAVRAHCGWHIAPTVEQTITVDGSGGEDLLLPTLHLTRVIEVHENGHLVPLDQIDQSSSGYLRRRGRRWTDRPGGITVTIEHGYTVEQIPDVDAAIRAISSRAQGPANIAQQASGPNSVRYVTGVGSASIGPGELDVLAPYRLTWI